MSIIVYSMIIENVARIMEYAITGEVHLNLIEGASPSALQSSLSIILETTNTEDLRLAPAD